MSGPVAPNGPTMRSVGGDSPISTVDFVAFDCETTGLNATTDKLVELAAVRFRDRMVIETFQTFVAPGGRLPPGSAQINGITDDMLVAAPELPDVLARFRAFAGEAVLVAHNAGFDMGFLRAGLHRAGLPDIKNVIIDTQVLAKRAYPGQRSYSLQNLAAMLAITADNAHRALDDSLTCMKLFVSCCNALSFMGELSLAEVLA